MWFGAAAGLVAVVVLVTGCGAPRGPAAGVPLCNPAAADYQKADSPTPAPCISNGPSASPVAVVGLTLDGGCEAIYGH